MSNESPTYQELVKRNIELELENSILKKNITYQSFLTSDLSEFEYYQQILNHIQQAVIITNPNGIVIFINKFAEQLYGYRIEEAIGKSTLEIICPDEHLIEGADRIKKIKKGNISFGEFTAKNKAGNKFLISTSTSPIYDKNENIIGIIGLSNDISEKKKNENVLRESEEMLRLMIESTDDMVTIHDTEGKYLFYSGPSKYKLNPTDVCGKTPYDFFDTETANQIVEEIKKTASTGDKSKLEIYIDWFGKMTWFEEKIYPLKKDNQIISVVKICSDITERKLNEAEIYTKNHKIETQNVELKIINEELIKAKETIEESEKTFRMLVENAPDAIYIQTEWKFAYVNQQALKLFGFETIDQIIGTPIIDRVHHDFHEKIKTRINELNEHKKLQQLQQLVFIKSDGSLIDVETSAIPFVHKGKNGGLVFIRNITERLKKEIEIKKLSVAVEQCPVTIAITDTKGILQYVNPAFTQITGYTAEEVIGQNPRLFKTDKTPQETYANLWNTIKNGKIWKGEFINKKKNGEFYYEEAIISPILNEKHEIINYISIKNDVTHKKKQDEIINQTNKQLLELNATKDKFFSIIAHDLKNPFNSILGFAELLEKNLQKYSTEKIEQSVKIIKNQAYSAYKLLENLLEWSRAQTGNIRFNPENLNLKSILYEMKMIKEMIAKNKNIAIHCNCTDSIQVRADKNMTNTVLRNIITNAIKYTPKEGNIFINALLKDNYAEIAIKDTGIGMSKENINKLFKITEKFSTLGTEKEQGTGLGLLLCKEFVEKQGGKIWVESEEGKGSEFRFTLPLIS